VITARIPPEGSVLLIAPVRGLTAEVGPAIAALADFGPELIGIGLSAEEMRGLLDYFVVSEAEPVVPLSPTETSEVRGLSRFGEVRVPNPSFVEILRWGRSHGVPVEPLDPSDEESAHLFADNIGYVELVRRTVRERRISRNPPAPSTPDEFALAWDRTVAVGRGSRDLARARDGHLARELARLRGGRRRAAVVVDRERFEEVRQFLTAGPPATITDS
jgi:hypothetical protein